MAQPWVAIAGNTLFALIGIGCFHMNGEQLLALPEAVALLILGMFMLRFLHPPAAAVALVVVLVEIGHHCYTFSLGDDRFRIVLDW